MDRRKALKTFGSTGLGLSAILGLDAPPSIAMSSNSEFSGEGSPSTLEALVKLSGSLDERLTLWWMEGLRYGVIDDIATPTFGFQIGFFNLHQKISNNAYRLTQMELTYYTDLESGELLETYDNPYTGKTNRVMQVRFGPMVRTQTLEGLMPSDNEAGAVKSFNAQTGPVTAFDGDIWIPTAVSASVELPFPSKPTLNLNQHTTFHGKLVDVNDPDVLAAPANLIFNNALSWEPWLQMWDHPGYSMGRAWGKKLLSMDELPERYLKLVQKVHPKLIEDPLSDLQKSAARAAQAD
jgi:hypothetical protein